MPQHKIKPVCRSRQGLSSSGYFRGPVGTGQTGLRNYWWVIRKQRWIILTIIVFVFMLTFIYTSFSPTVYQAIARMRITERRAVLSEDPKATQRELSRRACRQAGSLAVMERAAVKLRLISKDASERSESETKIMLALQSATVTRLVKGTDMFEIVVTHSNPVSACAYVNAIAYACVEYEKAKEICKMRNSIRREQTEIEAKSKETEEALRLFQGKEASKMAVAVYNRLQDLKRTHAALLQKYTEAHPSIIQLNKQINVLNQELTKYSKDEIEFFRLKREVNELTSRYNDLSRMEKHVEKLLRDPEAAFLGPAHSGKVKLANVAVETETDSGINVVSEATIPSQSIMDRKIMTLIISLCIGLVLGLATAFIMGHGKATVSTTEEMESLLNLPVLGIIPPLTIPTQSVGEDKSSLVEKFLGYPAAKEVRYIEVMKNQLMLNYSPLSPIVEAYRILRTNVIRNNVPAGQDKRLIPNGEAHQETAWESRPIGTFGRGGRIILVTSTSPLEGKTITTLNLAIIMAQKGERVLVIDADMRPDKSVGIHKIFGLDKGPGLSELLMDASKSDDAIRDITDTMLGGFDYDLVVKTPGIDNLNFITVGLVVPDSSELSSSTNLDILLRDLRMRYDYILMDCPPVSPVTDVLIIGPKVNSVIVVYQVGHTPKSALVSTKTALTKANIPVKGLVFNHMTPRTFFSERSG